LDCDEERGYSEARSHEGADHQDSVAEHEVFADLTKMDYHESTINAEEERIKARDAKVGVRLAPAVRLQN